MNKHFRTILFILLAAGQIAVSRYYQPLHFNVDLLYLIIFLIAIRSSFLPTIFSAALIGFVSDYLSGGVLGVFSFSRTLAAYFLNVLSRFLDLKKNIFIFLLILVSLFLSNLMAFVFHVLIFKMKVTAGLLLLQPLSTALIGTIIMGTKKAKSLLDVS